MSQALKTDPAASNVVPLDLSATLQIARRLEREKSTRSQGAEPSSRDRILDAAEALFGDHGPDVVSLRDISGKSGAATGLIHYHFPAKETLLEEVIARRAGVLSQIRRDALAALGEKPALGVLLEAFVRPLVELAAGTDPGWASYCKLITVIAMSESRGALIAKYLDETAKLYVATLKRSFPKADESNLVYGFGFTVILMANLIVKNRRIQTMSDGALPAADVSEVYRRMFVYAQAGLEALLGERAAP